jgi:hypothetical protein
MKAAIGQFRIDGSAHEVRHQNDRRGSRRRSAAMRQGGPKEIELAR